MYPGEVRRGVNMVKIHCSKLKEKIYKIYKNNSHIFNNLATRKKQKLQSVWRSARWKLKEKGWGHMKII